MPPKRRYFKKGKPNQILRVIKPFREFMQYEAAGGLVLISCVIIALIVSNLPFGSLYFLLWETDIGISVGPFSILQPLIFWVNDVLMVIFFFLIGLEIKREVLIGELSSPENAIAPIIGAIGGMIVPALIYLVINPPGTGGANSWAIPIATDIAITLGILSLFGKRIPTSLKIFVTTLAIVDDIGGVVVIALAYSHGIDLVHLGIAAGVFVLLIIMNRLEIRQTLPYAIFGVLLWIEFLLSGVHPTIAGILIAITIPATTKINIQEFNEISSELVRRLRATCDPDMEDIDIGLFLNATKTLEMACRDVETPLRQAEHALTKWLAFVIIPIFALANAGVAFATVEGSLLISSVPIGIILGLIIGKPLGVILSIWIGIRLGVIKMPEGVNWEIMMSTAFLTGIGFTISTFIASLAISEFSLLSAAKGAILIASLVSGLLGFFALRYTLRKREIALIPYIPSEIPKTPNIISSENNPAPESIKA
ncbi:MAG: Na+/H+ antiporter NhaA [Candidatus Thorarchaeota archaeon]|nr:Na+/H+ antiporter NhaA [Candidatus Thorarchaeota archaeon]